MFCGIAVHRFEVRRSWWSHLVVCLLVLSLERDSSAAIWQVLQCPVYRHYSSHNYREENRLRQEVLAASLVTAKHHLLHTTPYISEPKYLTPGALGIWSRWLGWNN